mgnify:FL=1
MLEADTPRLNDVKQKYKTENLPVTMIVATLISINQQKKQNQTFFHKYLYGCERYTTQKAIEHVPLY